MAERPRLLALAQQLGVLDSHLDMTGQRQQASDVAREALVAAMGFDGSSEAAAAAALDSLEAEERAQLVEPVQVAVEGSREARELQLRLPSGVPRSFEWEVELVEETGERHRAAGRGTPVSLPGAPAPGYHRVRLRVSWPGGTCEAEQSWILVPQRCTEVADLLDEPRAFGLWSNLYALHGGSSRGAGDLGELRLLVGAAADAGAAFVGMNPLHALWNSGGDISPYCPISRLYRNPLYLDIESIPELAETGGGAARGGDAQGPGHVDYAAAWGAKQEILAGLHRRFAQAHRGGEGERGRAYASYRSREGEALRDFATYMALASHLAGPGSGVAKDWHEWSAGYGAPGDPRVARFREEHAEAVDFHCWLQFELDRQLGALAGDARERGVALGLYGDLAVGSSGAGSDAWSFPGIFAQGATAGAPPDDFSNEGQSWGFPPVDPHALHRSGYGYWIKLLRAAFAHMGALRIDHMMGLTRLYWVPRDLSAREGAYVRYPERELMGILALESRRSGAVVIGEDLGTVPRGFPSRMAQRGILSYRVLTFEREGGGFRPAGRYSKRALVCSHTHDLIPMAGYLKGRDLELRHKVGQIEGEADFEAARGEREAAVAALRRRLATEGLLDVADPDASPEQIVAALYAFLDRTPCPLVAVSLDDLVGETEPVNLPGVGPDGYPSWTRSMTTPVEEITRQPLARAILAALSDRALPRDNRQPS